MSRHRSIHEGMTGQLLKILRISEIFTPLLLLSPFYWNRNVLLLFLSKVSSLLPWWEPVMNRRVIFVFLILSFVFPRLVLIGRIQDGWVGRLSVILWRADGREGWRECEWVLRRTKGFWCFCLAFFWVVMLEVSRLSKVHSGMLFLNGYNLPLFSWITSRRMKKRGGLGDSSPPPHHSPRSFKDYIPRMTSKQRETSRTCVQGVSWILGLYSPLN